MDANELPTDVEELKALLVQSQSALAVKEQEIKAAQQEASNANQKVSELSQTVEEQQQKIVAKEQQILELLRTLRGKSRERIDPDQLILFNIGELETLIEEQVQADKEASLPRKKKRKPRIIPDGLPTETIDYTLPEEDRLCPVDGQPMQPIRWEEIELGWEPKFSRLLCRSSRQRLSEGRRFSNSYRMHNARQHPSSSSGGKQVRRLFGFR